MLLAQSVWAVGMGMELISVSLAEKVLWARIEYIGIVTLGVAWLAFALQYTGRENWLTRGFVLGLSVIPLTTLALVFTNEAHGLIWSSIAVGEGAFKGLMVEHGTWFWVIWGYSYLLLLVGSVLLVARLGRTLLLYRLQSSILLFAVFVPWAGNLLYVLDLGPLDGLDLTPLAFLVSGPAFTLGIMKFGLLDILPVARSTVVENLRDGVVALDLRDRVVDLNPAARGVIGQPYSHIVGRAIEDLLPAPAMNGSRQWATGHHLYDISFSPLRNGKGRKIGRLLLLHDITEEQEARRALLQSEERYRAVVEQLSEGIFLFDPHDGRILQSNAALQSLLGYTDTELTSSTIYDLIAHAPEEVEQNIHRVVESNSRHLGERTYRRRDGTLVEFEVSSSVVTYGEKRVLSTVVRDISHRKALEAELRQQALHDPLTGLPNRRQFSERLEEALRSAQSLGLLFIDLDDFKSINDSLGHEAGDRLLVCVARRIEGCLRKGDTASRLGGDEFTVLLTAINNPDEASSIARRLEEHLREPFHLSGRQVSIGGSIGIICDVEDHDTPQTLMRRADRAMYAAKENRRDLT